MFRRAEAELAGAELDGASMVGDAPSDMEAGATLGLTNVLVAAEGSPAAREVAERGLPVAHRTDSLAGAARWLLSPAGPLGRP
jgi:phosphoglycolate phosphatase-like HAD superfamily hydrolase